MTTEAEIQAVRAECIAALENGITTDETIIQAASKCVMEFVCFSDRAQMFLIVDAKGAFRFGSPTQARRFSQKNAEDAAMFWNNGLVKMGADAQHLAVEAMSVERAVMMHQDRLKAALASIKEDAAL